MSCGLARGHRSLLARSVVLPSKYDRSCYLVNMASRTTNQRSSAPRRPRADGERTRGVILRAAASLATVDGLEGLSIGNLAAVIGMSKSGLYAHFGSKQDLQLPTVGR